ncbi:MAG: sulfite exporter TauE/SafE family protein [Planctomycetota bacterium]
MFLVVLAYILGILVGVILGLFGGGGVFLFPINHLILGQSVVPASAHAACLVAVAAWIGAIPRIRQNEIDWPTYFALGVPVSAGMLLVRLWLLNLIPQVINIGEWAVTKESIVLVPFAMLLLLSFLSMKGWIGKNLKPRTEMRQNRPVAYYSILIVFGLAVGIIPAFAGAGGGVLIVPLLVVLFGLPMKTVVGTSLAIVATKSTIGFLGGDLVSNPASIDVWFLAKFSVVIIFGAWLGSMLAHRMDGPKLKNIFAYLVLTLAVYILVSELLFPGAV